MVGRVKLGKVRLSQIFPSALSCLKLFVWILLIPTYNSGIEQYFNYTKHFEKKKQVGGVAYKCGKIASVSSDLFLC